MMCQSSLILRGTSFLWNKVALHNNVMVQQVPRMLYSSNVQSVKMAFNVFEDPGTDKSAPPLIIMHGLFGSKQNWRGISRALNAKLKRKVYAVDARNHGDSPHTIEHSSAHMTADVVELMRSEGYQKVSVMGHSMGGRTMMYFALKYPDLIERAIVVDISPIDLPRDFSQMEILFHAMKSVSVSPDLSMAQGRIEAERQLKSAVPFKETVDFILLNFKKRPTGEFYWTINIDSLHENLRHFGNFEKTVRSMPPFQGRMMFICGSASNFVKPDDWPAIQQIFPNSEIHWLDTGHLVHFEKPAEFIDLVTKFLQR